MMKKRAFFAISWAWTSRGRWSQTSSLLKGLLSRKTPPGTSVLEHVVALEENPLMAGNEVRFRN